MASLDAAWNWILSSRRGIGSRLACTSVISLAEVLIAPMIDRTARRCAEISRRVTAIDPVPRDEFGDMRVAVYQISAAYVNLGIATVM